MHKNIQTTSEISGISFNYNCIQEQLKSAPKLHLVQNGVYVEPSMQKLSQTKLKRFHELRSIKEELDIISQNCCINVLLFLLFSQDNR